MARGKQAKRIIALAAAFALSASPITVFAENNENNMPNKEYQAGEDESDKELLNLIIPIPETPLDNPNTPEKENQNSAVYGDPAGTVTTEGDADKSDGEWNYTETTVTQQGKAEVTTTEIKEKTEPGESDLEYTKSETEVIGTNDLANLSQKDSVPEEIEKAADTGYTYVGIQSTSHLWPGVIFDAPLTDEQKVELFGDRFENPEDAKNLVEKSFTGPDGKTYYTHRVDNMGSSMNVEGWYEDGEWVKPLNGTDKYLVVYSIPQQFMLMDNETGEMATVYCADQTTTAVDGIYYYIENLEDASYYTDEQAAMIRTIAQNGYWGTLYEKDEKGNIVYQKDADGNIVYQKDENGQDLLVEKKDADGNVVYEVETDADGNPLTNEDGTPVYKVDETTGEPIPVMEKVPVPVPAKGSLESMKEMLLNAKDADGNPLFTEDEINSSLTDGVALTATQMAIWSYSNKMDGVDFINAFFAGTKDAEDMQYKNWASELLKNIPKGTDKDPLSGKEDEVKLMFKLYTYLINMDPTVYGENEEVGEIPKTTENTIINSENFLKDMTLTVLEKAEDHDNNKDDDDTNDAYRTNLSFALVVTPSTENGDDLVVRVVGADGELLASGRLAGANEEGEDFETIIPDEKGNYTFTDIVMIEGDQEFKITMEGIQNLKEGVYLYTSQIETEDGEVEEATSQTMVGMASGRRGVKVTKSVKFKFEVDDEKVVVREYESDDDDEKTPPKNPPKNPPEEIIKEEDVPLGELPEFEEIEILDGDVILADVPKTGSSFMTWALLGGLSSVALALKKRK